MATKTVDLAISRLDADSGHANILDRDGKPDTTTPLTVTSDLESVATIAVDPVDNRLVTITAQGVGPVACHVRCGTSLLTVNVTVSDIDLSEISMTFDPPVRK